MRRRFIAALASAALLAGAGGAAAQDSAPAKELFGRALAPADLQARSIGSYAKGCLAGAAALSVDGPYWQAMRLSRNRNWGHPDLVGLVERLARDGAEQDGWPGLLVGDLSQPRGGPMTSGHSSHQVGLDADIWLTPMPNRTLSRQEREDMTAISMLKDGVREVDRRIWTDAHARIIRRAASYPETERIFVHPAIKKALCDFAGTDRAWLRKVRPWWGHHYHFHVRIRCPPGAAGCTNQDAPPPGDGCGADLAYWLGPEPWKPAPPSATPAKPPPPMTLAALPGACRDVLAAPDVGGAGRTINIPLPPARPVLN